MTGTHGIYELKKSDNRLKIRFSSTMDHIDDVCTSVTLFLQSLGELFTPHIFSVNLVIREGLTNAVRHGNGNDPQKIVDFGLDIDTDNTIRVRIEDQGDGFDWQQAGICSLPEEEDHGRGMTIMQTYFCQCRYNQKGNVLLLEKRLKPSI